MLRSNGLRACGEPICRAVAAAVVLAALAATWARIAAAQTPGEAVVVLDGNTATVVPYWSGDCDPGSAVGIPGGYGADMAPYDCLPAQQPWSWHLMPPGLIYRSYLAGPREPRFGAVYFDEHREGWLWDSALGGRVSLLRFGTPAAVRPDGWELQFEGAVFTRIDPPEERDVLAADFRAGVPIVYGDGPLRAKFGYYHISSHRGDEFLIKHPGSVPTNYTRDALVLGLAYYLTDNWRVYGETAWAFYTAGGAKPWEFQFGLEYSPLIPTGLRGAPFVATNGWLRQENNFGGNFVAQAGWQWRGRYGEQLMRLGVQYLNGASPQYEFFEQYERQIGIGLWYDF